MSRARFTKGPYEVLTEGPGATILGTPNRHVAKVYDGDEEGRANLRLLLAAPALYNLLCEANEELAGSEMPRELKDLSARISAALASIRGPARVK